MSGELAGLLVFFAAAFVWAALRRDPPKPMPPPPTPMPSPFPQPYEHD